MNIKSKIKKHIGEITNELYHSQRVSVIISISSAVLIGFYATISDYVPIDLKEPDVLFILSTHVLLFVFSISMVLVSKTWRRRFIFFTMSVALFFSINIYHEKFLLYDIKNILEPKIIIFYPEKYQDLEVGSEWKRTLTELPNSIDINGILFRVIALPTKFPENIEKTLIGRKVNSTPDIVGYICVSEKKGGILVQLHLPAAQDYYDLGFPWVERVYENHQINKIITTEAGVGNLILQYSISMEADGPHLGSSRVNFSIGVGISQNSLSYSKIRQKRMLQTDDIFEIPLNGLTPGIYYSCNMLSLAYLRLIGYTQQYCETIDKITKFNGDESSFDPLKVLDPKLFVGCLLENNSDKIPEIISRIPEKNRDVIKSNILRYILSGKEQEQNYAKSDLFQEDTLSRIVEVRELCNLTQNKMNQQNRCLLQFMVQNQQIQDSDPLCWNVLADKVDSIQTHLVQNIMFNSNQKQLDDYMVQSYAINDFLGVKHDSCNLPWIFYFIRAFMQYDNLDSDTFNEIVTRITNILQITECDDITLFGFIDIYKYISDKDLLNSFISDINELNSILNNGSTLKELLPPINNLLLGVKDSHTSSLNSPSNLSDDVISELYQELLDKVKKSVDPKLAYNIQIMLDEFFSYYKLNSNLQIASIDLSGDLDRMIKQILEKVDITDFLQDPAAFEVQRLINRGIWKEKYDIISDGISWLLDPALIKNPIHMILLYQRLPYFADNQEYFSLLLQSISDNYEEEKLMPLYWHYLMLQAYQEKKFDKAKSFARKIIDSVNTPQQSFYLFFLKTIQQKHLKDQKCDSLENGFPDWTGYLLKNEKQLLLEHLLFNHFDAEIWESVYATTPSHSLHAGSDVKDGLFLKTLSSYLVKYNHEYVNQQLEPKNNPKNFDSALLKVIESSQNACN